MIYKYFLPLIRVPVHFLKFCPLKHKRFEFWYVPFPIPPVSEQTFPWHRHLPSAARPSPHPPHGCVHLVRLELRLADSGSPSAHPGSPAPRPTLRRCGSPVLGAAGRRSHALLVLMSLSTVSAGSRTAWRVAAPCVWVLHPARVHVCVCARSLRLFTDESVSSVSRDHFLTSFPILAPSICFSDENLQHSVERKIQRQTSASYS